MVVCNLATFTLGEMDWGQTHIPLFHSEISYLKTYPRFEIPFFHLLKEHLQFALLFPWDPQDLANTAQPLELLPPYPAPRTPHHCSGSIHPSPMIPSRVSSFPQPCPAGFTLRFMTHPSPQGGAWGEEWGCPALGWGWAGLGLPGLILMNNLHLPSPRHGLYGEMLSTSQYCLELERNTCKSKYFRHFLDSQTPAHSGATKREI